MTKEVFKFFVTIYNSNRPEEFNGDTSRFFFVRADDATAAKNFLWDAYRDATEVSLCGVFSDRLTVDYDI